MNEIVVKIMMPEGLHMRPAMQISEMASNFSSEITIANGENRVNGKSIMEIMTLVVPSGENITISAEGEDAIEALEALRELIEETLLESESDAENS
ncbi:Phosphocarrier protein HPr [Sedimentisphaera cyanobacteriorum]|uniref:Phosphocarrier protein HPr n=1 Tax=Sedimentisphaera cyanobacteriorum TaxID=1940790 RepID=A0A1Q2HQE2_9BACT|nr:HPr family phosphocarrier protein [Sedimentisphaera cyanobacteriorum]AQQ09504.1 Phosphocarrier protein HPr [Sedimentisphaera cyanobacteriorum]